ncbi:MAG: transporter [Candidatus Eisenbacteria bacterium]|uniref:Transporter n=1 Tax=Eiseniibacteriota bacterium TaxID=2212470 RepID=A0A948W7X2_UNCEI|nr:transporter [Candidatus Eisenbacteria bacterium]MBU1947560.1 transporter [Candidatus Eisenbacteria bacterium]MBU2692710.1 transporter [Candidatus Eisenbacteria bacterium]
MRLTAACIIFLILFPFCGHAHHGVASLGVAGLEGPGAPIETSSSATLPESSFLGYVKLDWAQFKTNTAERDDEGKVSAFWMYGIGHGVTSYLSLYAFFPFYSKVVEDNSYNTSGFADISIMGVCGFKWDGGPRLVPRNESLDDLEDWHFGVYGGLSLPTGNPNLKNTAGEIDPGMSLGFGKPSYTIGGTITKQIFSPLTVVLESSFIGFNEYEYCDGTSMRFGNELRFNAALSNRILTYSPGKLRLDANLELNFLELSRDELDGIGEEATGGKVVYWVPGFRLYVKSTSLGFGIKIPSWVDLNEESEQQGAEGGEKYRLIMTFSTLL